MFDLIDIPQIAKSSGFSNTRDKKELIWWIWTSVKNITLFTFYFICFAFYFFLLTDEDRPWMGLLTWWTCMVASCALYSVRLTLKTQGDDHTISYVLCSGLLLLTKRISEQCKELNLCFVYFDIICFGNLCNSIKIELFSEEIRAIILLQVNNTNS